MTLTHNRLKDKVNSLVHVLYSDRGNTGASGDAADKLSTLFEFYKGDITLLSGTLANTLVTPLSLFDDAVVRTELFVSNDDASKILTLSLDALGANTLYILQPKDSITFPAYFLESVYMKASAPALSYTAWTYSLGNIVE
jgi:hypothetical protein